MTLVIPSRDELDSTRPVVARPQLVAQANVPQTSGIYSTADDQSWADAGYSRQLSLNAVAALQPQYLSTYQTLNDAQQLAYIKEQFPIMFRWDANEEARRQILIDVYGDQSPVVLAYEQPTADENSQEQLLFKNLGVNGLVLALAPEIRRDAVDKLGVDTSKFATMSDLQQIHIFNTAVGDAFMQQSIGRTTPAPNQTAQSSAQKLKRLSLFPAPSVPFLGGLTQIMGALAAKHVQQTSAAPTAPVMDPKTIVAAAAGEDPVTRNAVLSRYAAADPVTQTKMELAAVNWLMSTNLGPSPVMQMFALTYPENTQNLIFPDGKRMDAVNWHNQSFEQRVTTLQNHLIEIKRSADSILDPATPDSEVTKLQIMTMAFAREELRNGNPSDMNYRVALARDAAAYVYAFALAGT